MTSVLDEPAFGPVVSSPAPLELRVLGPLRVWRDGAEVSAGPRLQRQLLAVLLAHAGSPVTMSEMIDLIWEDRPPTSAINTIHKYIGALRRVLEPDLAPRASGQWLLGHGHGYRFIADPAVLDLAAYHQAEGSFRRALSESDQEAALRHCVAALRLWRGPSGSGIADTVSAQTMFAALDRSYLALATTAAQLARRHGRSRSVLEVIWAAAEIGPFHEPLHAELVANLALAGQRAEAVAAFQGVRDRLRRELGIEPGPELALAYRRVTADTTTGAPEKHSPAGPWPITRPAQLPADLPFFVGRTEILAELSRVLAVVDPPKVIALHGMPGVGKSAVAVHLAHCIAANYPDGQLHLDLRGFADGTDPLTAEQALRELLTGLGVPTQSVPEGRQAMAGLYRSLLSGQRVLVMLDNVRTAEQVIDLVPASEGCIALVTGRQRLTALRAAAGAHLMKVGLPSRQEARACLIGHLGGLPAPTDARTLDVVIERCGRLPLALAYAGARVAGGQSLVQVRIEAVDHAEIAAHQAFASSYHQLSARAAEVFRTVAPTLTPGTRATVDHTAAAMTRPAPDIHGVLDELSEVGLLEEHDPGHFECHVLVRAYAAQLAAAS
ncbi:BTAD domain-containing putative transcriptional regulator [Actinomycetospora sp. TBRC 11914]|uniref:BTAD domain-containing putative transcriptional regulator n=1 Tax=Actinomycetospora sp. TBRC 11914 TaxID=2729387 RepID=UPI00145ECDB5|nr:BTAD domain-containing putative transcriptional regulator [Actinomycetospora sp. TBRC 11914]NMO89340.1 AfsR/SARP family transcriptional regulator [Actinomycetospora sp. TBRC 11914]